jgi:hypothetical protein
VELYGWNTQLSMDWWPNNTVCIVWQWTSLDNEMFYFFKYNFFFKYAEGKSHARGMRDNLFSFFLGLKRRNLQTTYWDPKVTFLVARSSRGRCVQHLHDVRGRSAQQVGQTAIIPAVARMNHEWLPRHCNISVTIGVVTRIWQLPHSQPLFSGQVSKNFERNILNCHVNR